MPKTVPELELEHVLAVIKVVCEMLKALEPILGRQIKGK